MIPIARVGTLDIQAGISTKKFSKGASEMRSGLTSIESTVKQASSGILAFGATLAGVAALGGFTAFVVSSVQGLNTLSQTAERAGTTVNAFRGLSYAASATGGDVAAFGTIVGSLNRNLAEAATSETPFGQALRNIGLNAKDLISQKPDVAIGKISDRLAAIANPGERAYAITKLFGEEGLKVSRTLGLGSEAFKKYAAEQLQLSGGMNGFDSEKVNLANAAFARLGEAITGAKNYLIVELAPTIELVAGKIAACGVAGNGAFQTITATIGSYVVPAIGIVADVVNSLGIAFIGAKIIATKSFAEIVKALAYVTGAFDKTVNYIRGTKGESVASTFLKGFADELDKTAGDQIKDWNKALMAEPPSNKIKKFYDDIAVASEKASKSMADAAKEPNKIGEGLVSATITDRIKTMSRELTIAGDKIGRNDAFSKLYDLKNAGASDKQLFGVSQQLRNNQLKEEVTGKNSDTINSAPQTRIGQYFKIFEDFAKAQQLRSKGLLNDRDYSVAQLGARKDMLAFQEQTMQQPAKFAGAMELGSQDSYSDLLQAIQGSGKFSVEAQQLELAKRQLDMLTAIARASDRNANFTPPAITIDTP